jgi:hypothetical protein
LSSHAAAAAAAHACLLPLPLLSQGVDISPFINNLPGGTPTNSFRSDDASGSTSQAANIQVGV